MIELEGRKDIPQNETNEPMFNYYFAALIYFHINGQYEEEAPYYQLLCIPYEQKLPVCIEYLIENDIFQVFYTFMTSVQAEEFLAIILNIIQHLIDNDSAYADYFVNSNLCKYMLSLISNLDVFLLFTKVIGETPAANRVLIHNGIFDLIDEIESSNKSLFFSNFLLTCDSNDEANMKYAVMQLFNDIENDHDIYSLHNRAIGISRCISKNINMAITIADSGMVQYLNNFLLNDYEDIKFCGLIILDLFSTSDEEIIIDAILSDISLGVIIQLACYQEEQLEVENQVSSIQQKSLNILANFLGGEIYPIMNYIENNIYQAILNALENGSFEIKKKTLYIISNIAISATQEEILQLFDEQMINSYLEQLLITGCTNKRCILIGIGELFSKLNIESKRLFYIDDLLEFLISSQLNDELQDYANKIYEFMMKCKEEVFS